MNGKLIGFISCKRGVRQGDPLSPLLLCLAEDVLSRGITYLVETGQLDSISGSRVFRSPSHIFMQMTCWFFAEALREVLCL